MQRVLIVGAGLAGLRTAESLRREGFEGAITMIGAEPELPYDRPPLSKDVLLGRLAAQQTLLRPPERLAELAIDLKLAAPALSLDLSRRVVLLEREEVPYDALVIATGSAARRIPAFEDHPAVMTLRTIDDARRLRTGLESAT